MKRHLMKRHLRRSRAGFTLIELLVVLVILALLAGIVLPRFLDRGEQAKVSAAKGQIGTFKSALQLYALDNGQPPTSQQGLQALIQEPTTSPRPRGWRKPYLSDVNEVPQDPWGNEYVYVSEGDDFLITSYGADGKEGGDGNDADILSNQLNK
jgi:general secretion pathway protein G